MSLYPLKNIYVNLFYNLSHKTSLSLIILYIIHCLNEYDFLGLLRFKYNLEMFGNVLCILYIDWVK